MPLIQLGIFRFSPVIGINKLATSGSFEAGPEVIDRFSPVIGINKLATFV